jgi:hypothetical protein
MRAFTSSGEASRRCLLLLRLFIANKKTRTLQHKNI